MSTATVVGALRGWFAFSDPGAHRRCHVAFSGGLDSMVLLHALASLRGDFPDLRVEALHLDHALHPDSRRWSRQCREACRRLDVPFAGRRLESLDPAGDGLESAARTARYDWFARRLSRDGVLVTAHHRDDQAETLLYNLFRGAGLRGLSAMPTERPFARGTLARPLLAVPRAALAEYATRHRLEWIEDPSNAILDYDRNYIRHRLVPAIAARWPATGRNLHRAAQNAREAAAILERLASRQVADSTAAGVLNPLSAAPVLDIAPLAAMPVDECLNLLRHWIGLGGARPPSRDRLLRLHADLVRGDAARGACTWVDGSVRRYRDRLYLAPPLPGTMPGPSPWCFAQPRELPGVPLMLVARRRRGRGVVLPLGGQDEVSIDFATADRVVRERPGGPRRSLRKLFQDAGVPPWLRRVLPRISADGELLCVPGVVESGTHRAGGRQSGICFELVRRGDAAPARDAPPR